MQYPECFDDMSQYRGWRQTALLANEAVSPCADCTPEYRERMEHRCKRQHVQNNFTVYNKRNEGEKK